MELQLNRMVSHLAFVKNNTAKTDLSCKHLHFTSSYFSLKKQTKQNKLFQKFQVVPPIINIGYDH